jgi:hypothetical protein
MEFSKIKTRHRNPVALLHLDLNLHLLRPINSNRSNRLCLDKSRLSQPFPNCGWYFTIWVMLLPSFVALSGVVFHAAAQGGYGVELDAPMLGGGGPRTSKTAMLRFGCSQVVIERLDPCVNKPIPT